MSIFHLEGHQGKFSSKLTTLVEIELSTRHNHQNPTAQDSIDHFDNINVEVGEEGMDCQDTIHLCSHQENSQINEGIIYRPSTRSAHSTPTPQRVLAQITKWSEIWLTASLSYMKKWCENFPEVIG